jgi:hypothetical protein
MLKNYLLLFLLIMVSSCDKTQSIVLLDKSNGVVKIDNKNIASLSKQMILNDSTKLLYYLNLKEGYHKFMITNNYNISYDTLIYIEEEEYIVIDLETGKIIE